MAGTQSLVVRDRLAKENEEQVIVANALEIEWIISGIRLFLILAISLGALLSQRLEGAPRPDHALHRLAAVVLYIAFSVGTLIAQTGARKTSVRPNLRTIFRIELFTTAVDLGFMTFMGTVGAEHQLSNAQRGAIVFALVMCFSLGRARRINVVISSVLAAACYAFGSWYTDSWRTGDGVFVLCCYAALGALLFRMHRQLRKMFVDLRRLDSLTRFLSPQVAAEVMKYGDASLAPVQREVTVLFSDIRDFTTFSERQPPGAVLAFLDEYFGHMSQLVKAHEGIVNKFIGDGMLAVWGVPQRNPAHAELALKAALDMRKVVEELNATRRQQGAAPIRIGIGIHTGVVAAGMLGGADQHEYTVIGDAVNVASRVESLTKALGVDILVSESAWCLAGDQFKGQRISEQHVKGRREGVVVYALEDRLPKPGNIRGSSAA